MAALVELALRGIVCAEVTTAADFRIKAKAFVAAGEVKSAQHRGHDQDVFVPQREEVRAFPDFAGVMGARPPGERIAEPDAQGMQVLPAAQIAGAAQQRRAAAVREAGTHDHPP